MDGKIFLEEARRLVVDLGPLRIGRHAQVRDPKAGKLPLSAEAIKECVLRGVVTEGPAPDIVIGGGWKGTISRLAPVDQKASVACVVVKGSKIFIITAYGQTAVRLRKRPNPPGSPDTGDEEVADDKTGNEGNGDDQV